MLLLGLLLVLLLGLLLGRAGECLDLHAAADDRALDHRQSARHQAAADLSLLLQGSAAGDLQIAVDLTGAQQLLGVDVTRHLRILADGNGARDLYITGQRTADEVQAAGGDIALDDRAQRHRAGGNDLALECPGDLHIAVRAQCALQ